MHNAFVLMQIFQGFGYLHNNVSAEVLAEVGKANDLMEQLATRAELEDDIVMLARLGKIYQLDDVGVI